MTESFVPALSSPEAAVRALEDAYRARDLEAAIACKDFMAEAELMIRRINSALPVTEELVRQAALVLEHSFREHIAKTGFPDFAGVQSSFPYSEFLADNLVLVTELCSFPDGRITEQKLFVARVENGWRVLNPASSRKPPDAA
ncbi:MAG TPA: hypothetical protein PLB02_04030 [Thermoanaerobaculia bacterium]|nr:hypothetical protein [Thermoanaerobaculia bacterium]